MVDTKVTGRGEESMTGTVAPAPTPVVKKKKR
jgi:hypothetical protein